MNCKICLVCDAIENVTVRDWRRFLPGSVILIAVVWTVDAVWAARTGIRLGHTGSTVATLGVLAANLLIYRGRRGGERASALAAGFAAFFALASGTAALSYLAATVGAPLADARLARADAALGFDWLAWYRFVQAHDWLHGMLRFAYVSMSAQIMLCLLLLPLTGMARRNQEFIAAMAVALLPTIALFAAFPAASAWVQYGVSTPAMLGFLDQLLALREGRMAAMQLDDLYGLITFPSFHVVTAVLVAYATRGTRLAFLALTLNLFMAVSALSEGGHYLVDVIAGVLVAGLAIVVVRCMRRFDSPAARAL